MTTSAPSHRLAYVLLVLTALFWSGNFVLARAMHAAVPPMTLSFMRWLIAFALLAPFSLRHAWRERALLWQCRGRILALSLLGITAFNSLVYTGVQTTTATNAVLLNSFIPILTVLFGALWFGQRLGGRQMLGLAVSFVGVLAELVVGDGGTVVSDQVIAKIDTEGKAGAAAPAAAPAAAAAAPAAAVAAVAAPAAGGSKGDVAMPAAAKLLADNNLSVGDVAGSGKDGRVTKGDVLAAVAGGAKPAVAPSVIPTGVPTKALPQVAAPSAPNLGDRPEQRVPMTRLRAQPNRELLAELKPDRILISPLAAPLAPTLSRIAPVSTIALYDGQTDLWQRLHEVTLTLVHRDAVAVAESLDLGGVKQVLTAFKHAAAAGVIRFADRQRSDNAPETAIAQAKLVVVFGEDD